MFAVVGERRGLYGCGMSNDLDTHQHDVDAAKAAYVSTEADLATALAPTFRDGQEALAPLIQLADEFGAEHAIEALRADPERFGALSHDGSGIGMEVGALLKAMIDISDKLDLANARREATLRQSEPDKDQVLMFGGKEYEVDRKRGELRSVAEPAQRFRLPAMERVVVATPTVAGLRDHDDRTPKAVPMPEQSKDRGR